jgi:DNA helicase-2/ATP-dependent DNA helicase PcrA
LGGKGLSGKVRALLEEIRYFDYLLMENQKNDKVARFKMLNVEHLLESIETWESDPDNFDTGLFAWLNRITLLTRDDLDDDGLGGKVNLMTIHAAKGLEFPVVFIAGAEEGLMPHARSLEDDPETPGHGGAIEEERRLFYVAITRARDKLFITTCLKRKRQQTPVDVEPSRFIAEIPDTLVEMHDAAAAEAQIVDPAQGFAALQKRLAEKSAEKRRGA